MVKKQKIVIYHDDVTKKICSFFFAKEFMVLKVLCLCIHDIQVKVPQNQRDKALPKPIFQVLYQNCRAGNK